MFKKTVLLILWLIQSQASLGAASIPKKATLIACQYNAANLQCSLPSAAEQEHWNCIIGLLKKGASYDESDEYGDTILHGLASFGYYINHANLEFYTLYRKNFPKILAHPDINPNAQNDCGDTPLHVAIKSLNIYFCELLLGHYAIKCHIKNNIGETPRNLIQKNIEVLRKKIISRTGSPYQRLHGIVPEKTCDTGLLVDQRFSIIAAWENLLRRLLAKA